ncbi:hypothetical protein [Streptomyces sp. Z26]|uniref:hypothetical protein n=1 Tax=Streptomyces sp. Z26 TaxID=2500177 RepID=UPI000EF14690|nr:hypothetical protein [Streptomyces sp. Z26]RLL65774.1 hypothetical protein D7M15_01410 [Streptomyces sp. Z26]
MSSGHKTLTVFLTTIVGLLLILLGLCLHWPLWVWPVLATLLPVSAMVTAKLITPREELVPRECRLVPDVPVEEPERREQRVTGVTLPSSETDYDFLLSATVRWSPLTVSSDAPPVSPGGIAIDAVLERAARVTMSQPPTRSGLAQHRLNGVLGVMEADPTGRVLAMAEEVTLTLSDADASRLKKLSTVRKDTVLWEHERKYECDRRTYLGADVLKNTGSAVVWWLTKNDDEVKKTVDDIGMLAQLTAAANNEEVPELFEHMAPYPRFAQNPGYPPSSPFDPPPEYDPTAEPTTNGYRPPEEPGEESADRFGDLLATLGMPPEEQEAQSALLAQQTAQLLTVLQYDTAAEAIRKRFDSPTPSEEEGEAPEDVTVSPEEAGDSEPAASERGFGS